MCCYLLGLGVEKIFLNSCDCKKAKKGKEDLAKALRR